FEAYVAGPLSDFVRSGGERQRLWIAERGGRIVGCVAVVAASPRAGPLRWFLVGPRAPGLGAGRGLVGGGGGFCKGWGGAGGVSGGGRGCWGRRSPSARAAGTRRSSCGRRAPWRRRRTSTGPPGSARPRRSPAECGAWISSRRSTSCTSASLGTRQARSCASGSGELAPRLLPHSPREPLALGGGRARWPGLDGGRLAPYTHRPQDRRLLLPFTPCT